MHTKAHTLVRTLALAAITALGATAVQAQVINLSATIRDFKITDPRPNPDFEGIIDGAVVTGIVENTLGVDGKPVYAHGAASYHSVNSETSFNQWYNWVSDVNYEYNFMLSLYDDGSNGDLVAGDGRYTYVSNSFFPIDGMGWGNEGEDHNFGFTLELHTTFGYDASRNNNFTFTGDDDVFVFINKQLAIDLGGVHQAATGSVDLNAQAGVLGLVDGNNYDLDFFFAERHTTLSEFAITVELPITQNAVPEPSTYGLMAAGLLGAVVILRRRRAAKS